MQAARFKARQDKARLEAIMIVADGSLYVTKIN